MKDDGYLIDPRFNLHNGFLNREYLNSNLINNLYFNNYIKDIKIIHYSDNFILNKKFHPFFKEYIKKY